MASFSGFFDTSGTETSSTVLTVVGVVGEAADWTEFDSEWGGYLKTENVARFRMHDFAHFHNSFADGWRENENRRRALIDRLTVLTASTVYKVFARSIDLAMYDQINREYQLTESIGGAYAVAQANCVLTAMDWVIEEAEPDDTVMMLVEQGDVGQGGFTRLMRTKLGDVAPLVKLYPKTDPLTGEEITPFHVADFIAYEIRRHHEGVQAGADPSRMRAPLKLIRAALYPAIGVITDEEILAICVEASVPRRPSQ